MESYAVPCDKQRIHKTDLVSLYPSGCKTDHYSTKDNAMLNHKIAIYIPSTINGNETAPAAMIEKWLRASKTKLGRLFGGFTSYSAMGGWMSDTHGLIEEPIIIVQAFTDDDGLAHLDQVRELAKEMAKDMGQEMVSIQVDETLNFIEA